MKSRTLGRSNGIFVLVIAAVILAGIRGSALGAPAPAPAKLEPVQLDSGPLDNASDQPAVVFSREIDLGPEVPWFRVVFSAARLSPGSLVRVTSLLDGDWQTLDAQQLEEWGYATAFFNGSAARIELIAAPHARGESIKVENMFVGRGLADVGEPQVPDGGDGTAAICDMTDERVLSNDARVARLWPVGCTAFIIHEPPDPATDKCHLSAGHCFLDEKGGREPADVLQFNVPPSVGCSRRHPQAAFQFAVRRDTEDARLTGDGCGTDWAVFRCHRNPVTGLTTYQTQGAAFFRGLVPAPGPDTSDAPPDIRVTGYGRDGGQVPNACAPCVPGDDDDDRNQVQQREDGNLFDVANCDPPRPGVLPYKRLDDCPGNSGSPIIRLDTDQAIGIQVQGGCKTSAICCVAFPVNIGTRLDADGLQAAMTRCGRVAADPPPGHKMHYPQLPDPFGWDVLMTYPKILADDWRCTESGLISEIRFWGSWRGDYVGNITRICVWIYSDYPGPPYSRPANLLWERYIYPPDFKVGFEGYGEQGWYDPNTEYYLKGDHLSYFNVIIPHIPEAFKQRRGDVYWLALQVDVADKIPGDGVFPSFGWKTTYPSLQFRDDAVWSDDKFGPWSELRDPQTHESLDLAFVVNGPRQPIPTVSEWGLIVMTLLLLAGAKVYFGRRRRAATAGIGS